MVKLNERGRRIGESHPMAKLMDWEVVVLLELRDEGWGYKRLAKHFDISTRTVRGICNCTIRAQTPMQFR